jgi:cell division protein FtsL
VWGTALLTAVSLFVLVSFHVVAVQHAFELDSLQKQRNEEELRYERLRAEVAALSSPQAVVEAAEAQGMVPAPTVDYLEAPPAAPRGQPTDDKTARTLVDTADETKRLGP